ncbi:MAG: AAA family ATPase, partial [Candidatus Moranbacteria bacterium]|nr:AAA family ATPase [Candidatus Moranbacteria bacterium]
MSNKTNGFEEIKGYPEIKAELAQLCDIMTNPNVYQRLGVSMPRGLLLSGEPGVGKTLMANCLIKETGWNAVLCKKNRPNGVFTNYIKECFEEAEKAA